MNKIYETQSYKTELETTVTNCIPCNKGYHITLADSVIFPNEGGQYCDKAQLITNTNQVINILDGIVDNNEVNYLVDVPIDINSKCIIKIDWETRFMRMQQHSGEHILSGLLYNIYGYINVGFHLSDDDFVTLDTSGELNDSQILDLEARANQVIYENVPIVDSYPTTEELEKINYRSKKQINGQVRLITIGTKNNIIDICACCAPHVKSTGEIGIIKIMNHINYKGGTRLEILCGKRAFNEICKEHLILKNLALGASTSIYNIEESISNLKSELIDTKRKLSQIIENDLLSQIENMNVSDIPCIFIDELHSPYMKSAYNALINKFSSKYVGVFLGNDEKGYRYFAGNPNLGSVKLKEIFTQRLDAKGGGNDDMIQGKVNASAKTIVEIFK